MGAILEYIDKGGVFIYPILAGSVWAFTLLVERLLFFKQVAFRITKLSDEFFRTLKADGTKEARSYLTGQTGVLKNVLTVALENERQPMRKIEARMEAVLLQELPVLSKFLNTLATLGAMMPILGLLGTVTGMIATFQVIALQGTGDAQALADGISEALVTTQAGLVAALPILLGHNFLSNRLQKIVSVVRACTAQVLDRIEEIQDGQ